MTVVVVVLLLIMLVAIVRRLVIDVPHVGSRTCISVQPPLFGPATPLHAANGGAVDGVYLDQLLGPFANVAAQR
jgi:hypothetical protein